MNPSPSFPIKFSAGTLTSSKVIKVVPEDHTPYIFIFLVFTPGKFLSMIIRLIPPGPLPVLTAVVKQSEYTPVVMNFFIPVTT